MDYESALMFLKDFAEADKFKRNSFLFAVLDQEEVITNEMVTELAEVYHQMKPHSGRHRSEPSNIASLVRFIKDGSKPGQVVIKVIKQSNDTEDVFNVVEEEEENFTERVTQQAQKVNSSKQLSNIQASINLRAKNDMRLKCSRH